MNKHLKISVLIIIMLVLSIGIIYSQTEQYKFRHLTTEDGLPSNFCWSVMKDSKGFIWITTRAGLCRYDGYNIKVFQYDPDDSTSLSDNRLSPFNNIVEDNKGNVWIGTYNGLNKFWRNTGKFKRYLYDTNDLGSIKSNFIYSLLIDRSGTLWVGTGRQGGLNKYIPDKDQFINYVRDLGDTARKIPSIFSLYEDQFGILWVGTADGIYQFDREIEHFIQIPYKPKHPDPANPLIYKYMNEDVDGTLFIGTQFGYLTYNRVLNKIVPFTPLYDERKSIVSLGILPEPGDETQGLWMIASGLYQFNRQTYSLSQIPYDQNKPNSIRGELLMSFFKDETGIIWIPSEIGINILTSEQKYLKTHPEFSENYMEPITFLEDRKGDFWIGTSKLVCFDSKMKLVKEYQFPVSKEEDPITIYTSCLLEDVEGNIWVGTQFNGLYLLEMGKQALVRCTILPSDPYTFNDIIEDSRGTLWFATEMGLFQNKKGGNPLTDFHQDTLWGSLNKTEILCINEDRSENIWIGTTYNNGLFRQPLELRGTGTFINYKHDPGNNQSISNDWVWSVYEDVNNNIWIATEHGLNKYIKEENQFLRYYSDADLGANFIYDLTGDNKGYLWMTTESGLIRFNPAGDADREKASNRFKQILPFNEIFPYRIYRDKAGKMFVGASYGSGKGYISFYPDSIKDNTHIPPVIIVDFKVHNETIELDTIITQKKNITLNYNQNFFSFEFAALDYVQPEKNQYAHWLEGLEDDWIYTGHSRFVNYTSVPPGNYVLHVTGSNNDGYWNEEGANISITILPPPWKTWWAYLLYLLFIISIFIIVIRFYLRRQRLLHKLELEQIQTEKLEELDSMKSRFFANISHEFRTPLTLILGPLEKIKTLVSEEVKQNIQIMQRNAYRLQRLIDQLLNLSKLESSKMKLRAKEENVVSLINTYLQAFESLAKQKKIELVFSASENQIIAYVDRDKLEKIIYNLLSNAFKFTDEGGRIEVSITPLNHTIRGDKGVNITVSDTGQGILPEHLSHIFNRFYQAEDSSTNAHEGTGIGLALTKELVELHHGSIEVVSLPTKGTTFSVFIPMGKKHLSPDEIVSDIPPAQDMDTNETEWVLEPTSTLSADHSHQLKADSPIVLVVEDNSDLRFFIRSYLDEFYQVIEASNGEDGLKKSVENIPDIIISDVMMPKMDGFELCRNLKNDERTSHIPVILLTARAGMESRIEGLETGADDFITKPFDAQELITRTKNLIRQRATLKDSFRKEIEYEKQLSEPEILSMDQQFIRKAKKVIEDNLLVTDFSIEDFAIKMALSRMQLHRKLKALVDQSASGFIRTIRLNKAVELLDKRTGTVSEIAFEVGFNTLPYFTKCFHEQFGVNPSEYISHHKKD